MDDNFANFGGDRIKTPNEEAWHREQERKKYDIIRIKNPTGQDFYVKYDTNQYQKVPANSDIDVPRYIATRYIVHMKDYIVNETAKKMHDDYLKERKEKGHPEYKSKWEENEETYLSSEYPKTNDPKIMAEIIDKLWIGLVYEFGRDVPPDNQNPRSGEVDLTPPEIKILAGLEKRRVSPEDKPMATFVPQHETPPMPPAPPSEAPEVLTNIPSPFSSMNERLDANEVTRE